MPWMTFLTFITYAIIIVLIMGYSWWQSIRIDNLTIDNIKLEGQINILENKIEKIDITPETVPENQNKMLAI